MINLSDSSIAKKLEAHKEQLAPRSRREIQQAEGCAEFVTTKSLTTGDTGEHGKAGSFSVSSVVEIF